MALFHGTVYGIRIEEPVCQNPVAVVLPEVYIILAVAVAENVNMEVFLYGAPVMVESARRNGVAVAQVRAHPEPVDILAGEPSVTVEGVDNPYISAYQVTCHILVQ